MEASKSPRVPVPAESAGHSHDEPANILEFPSQTEEGFFNEALVAQQEALDALPEYDVSILRRSSYKETGETAYGKFYQESVRYSDGAVRLITIGEPKKPKSPYPIASGDPWLTGPNGFNNLELRQLVQNGFPVVWNHHHGRHATLPTSRHRAMTMINFLSSKSIAKSASHSHALLDDLETVAGFDTSNVICKGYSRSAMTGEAIIALSAKNHTDRNVLWSDYEAACFLKGVGVVGLAKILGKQIGHEIKALGNIGNELSDGVKFLEDKHAITLEDIKGTFDIHPLNIAHEVAWIQLLIGGDTGIFADALPLDTRGIRTFYENDFMSQRQEWEKIHSVRPNITVLDEPGAHFSGAERKARIAKNNRFKRLGQYIVKHEGDLSQITAKDVLPRKKSTRRPKMAT